MTGTPVPTSAAPGGRSLFKPEARSLARQASERRFRMLGLAAVLFGILALAGLLTSILANGASSFRQTFITLDVFLDPAKLDKAGKRDPLDIQKITTFTIQPLIKASMKNMLAEKGIAL